MLDAICLSYKIVDITIPVQILVIIPQMLGGSQTDPMQWSLRRNTGSAIFTSHPNAITLIWLNSKFCEIKKKIRAITSVCIYMFEVVECVDDLWPIWQQFLFLRFSCLKLFLVKRYLYCKYIQFYFGF